MAKRQTSDTVSWDLDGDVAVIAIDHPPVNALGQDVRAGLVRAFEEAESEDRVSAILLYCEGRTFIAGADIKEFGQPPVGPTLHELHDVMEQCSKPIVAAIHGSALGGGLETALCCHFRVAVHSARFGLPEVHLGLLPGAGGTQRLPRIVGVEPALEMMVFGKPISAERAQCLGLLDAVVTEAKPGGLEYCARVIAESLPLRKVRDMEIKLDEARQDPELCRRFRHAMARKTRGLDAPDAIVDCVEDALSMSFDEAIREERRRFMELMQGDQSAAQRHYFFAERKAAKIPDVPRETPTLPVQRVGIVGAGTMGGGIAMNFLNAGLPVNIVEASEERLQAGLGVIRNNYERTVRRGGLNETELNARLALLQASTSLDELADCDLVIEAVYENLDLKKQVFRELDAIVKPGAILATNTSALDVNLIAAETSRPDLVLGTHFFSPANIMKLCEVVRAEKTSHEVLATVMSLAKRIGKIPVVSGVCHGFIGNRILFAREEQCQRMIFEGPLPWDVDRVLYEFGLPLGPFAMNDLAGLDIGWDPETSKGETLRDRLCELGRRGQKTGAGFYNYDPETRARTPEPLVEQMVLEFSKAMGIERRAFSDEEILNRALLPMINEGAKILAEGISARPSDIDVVWVNGYGWPVYRGGPMHYADTLGLANVLARLKDFQELDEEFWRPAPLLEQLVADGKAFADLN